MKLEINELVEDTSEFGITVRIYILYIPNEEGVIEVRFDLLGDRILSLMHALHVLNLALSDVEIRFEYYLDSGIDTINYQIELPSGDKYQLIVKAVRIKDEI